MQNLRSLRQGYAFGAIAPSQVHADTKQDRILFSGEWLWSVICAPKSEKSPQKHVVHPQKPEDEI